ncbi:hypothetical protein Vafri_9144 [Volvox africanus]|uniref:FAD-dependent oxidoreductase domain-containing protein 1 n=1 Tax=Volvox africanus TaxID=51714 RepID=A0A8J4B8F4_9CHLO|nr:hypothetical protein Vafri_9144 [Volvox africanus]
MYGCTLVFLRRVRRGTMSPGFGLYTLSAGCVFSYCTVLHCTALYCRIHARHALVLSAGVWTGDLLSAATGTPAWSHLLQPRRGHLLEMPRPEGMPPVTHGIMEVSYTKHYTAASTPPPPPSAAATAASSSAEPADITFTATTSANGNLLIGSSRESNVWDTDPSPAIIAAILQRAATFLPGLRSCADSAAAAAAAAAATGGNSYSDAVAGLVVRVGLRPYAAGGLPLVGPVVGSPGLFCFGADFRSGFEAVLEFFNRRGTMGMHIDSHEEGSIHLR